jgi:hypothetical protein
MFEKLDDPVPFDGIDGARERVASQSARIRRRRRMRRRVFQTTVLVVAVGLPIVAVTQRSPEDSSPAGSHNAPGHQLELAEDTLDPLAVDYFAPVSGQSKARGLDLAWAIAKERDRRIRTCMVAHGLTPTPEPVRDDSGYTDFPDAPALLRDGLVPAPPPDTDMPTDPAWVEGYTDCTTANPRLVHDISGWDQVVETSLARPAEHTMWAQAATCLQARGWRSDEVPTERAFLTAVQTREMASPTHDALDAIDLAAGKDYVTCAQPVWDARTTDLTQRRTDWLQAHRAQVIAAQIEINDYLAGQP